MHDSPAARLLDKEGTPYDAYPYGVIPRLLLTWLVTQVKQTGERSINLGPSLRAFMRDLGIRHCAKGNAAVIEQTKRLIQSSFVLTMDDTSGGVSTHAMQGLMIASRAQLWFTAKMESQPALLESEIELSQEFYDSIMETAIPVDMRHLAALRRQGVECVQFSGHTPHLPSRTHRPPPADPGPPRSEHRHLQRDKKLNLKITRYHSAEVRKVR